MRKGKPCESSRTPLFFFFSFLVTPSTRHANSRPIKRNNDPLALNAKRTTALWITRFYITIVVSAFFSLSLSFSLVRILFGMLCLELNFGSRYFKSFDFFFFFILAKNKMVVILKLFCKSKNLDEIFNLHVPSVERNFNYNFVSYFIIP